MSDSIKLTPGTSVSQAMDVDSNTAPETIDHQGRNIDMADPTIARLHAIVADILDLSLAKGKKPERIDEITVRSHFHNKYKLPLPYDNSMAILDFHALGLTRLLDKQRYESTAFYQWLVSRPKQPAMPLSIRPDEILPRLVKRKAKQGTTTSTSQTAVQANEEADGRPSSELEPLGRSRQAGRVSGLRLTSVAKKRYRSPHPDASDPGVSGKRAKRPPPGYRDEDMLMDGSAGPTSPEADDDEDDDDESESESEDEPLVKVVVKAERLSSMSPTGPDGRWHCDFEGCEFSADAVQGEEGRDLVRQHRTEHHRTEQIDLAMQEGRGRHLPVEYVISIYWA